MDRILSFEAKKVIGLIIDDIKNGQVPTGLSTFSQLHDYVDANTYLLDAMPDLGWTEQADMDKANSVCDEVSGWLYDHRNCLRSDELSKPVI